MFVGRIVKVAFVLTADLFVYMVLLAFFLKMGPAGLGPRLFQLGLALALPAMMTYRTLWKKGTHLVMWRPLAGMAVAGLLTPSFLESIPILSLAASAALAATPYYASRHLPGLLKTTLRRVGGAYEHGDSRAKLDLLLLKRHVYYFRWWGPAVPARRGSTIIKAEGQEYLRVGRTGLSDAACRKKALAGAMEIARSAPGVIIPATAEEVSCLEWGTVLEERIVSSMRTEREALAPLFMAGKRRLTCAVEGAPGGFGVAADVVLRAEGDLVSVKLLSGKAVTMTRGRLRDLLDAYDMVVARE